MKEMIISLIQGAANGLIWCVNAVDSLLLKCKGIRIEFTLYNVIMFLMILGVIVFAYMKISSMVNMFKAKQSRSNLKARLGLAQKLAINSFIKKNRTVRSKSRRSKEEVVSVPSITPEEREEKRKQSFEDRLTNLKMQRSSA